MSDHIGNKGMKRWIELLLGLFRTKQELMEELNLTVDQLREILKEGDENMDLTELEQKLDDLSDQIEATNKSISSVTTKLEAVNASLNSIDSALTQVNTKVDQINAKNYDGRFNAIDTALEKLGKTLEEMSIDVASLPTPDGFQYTTKEEGDDKIITLTKYTGADANVIIYPMYNVGGKAYHTVCGGTTGLFAGNTTQDLTVQFNNGVKIINAKDMFYHCTKMKSVVFGQSADPGIDMTECTDMSNMFKATGLKNSNFTTIDLSNCHIAGVTTMEDMFGSEGNVNKNGYTYDYQGGGYIKTIKFGKDVDTSKCKNFQSMFSWSGTSDSNAPGITSLSLTMLDTRNATAMMGMFNGIRKLTSLTVSSETFVIPEDVKNGFMFSLMGSCGINQTQITYV